MSGGSDQQPVAGTSSSDTSGTSNTHQRSQQTQTTTLPDWAQAGIQQNFQDYTGNVDQFGNAIQDWQAAPFSADQLAGFEAQRQAATGQYMQTPLDQLLATARGDYLYGGPGFDAAVEAAYRAGKPGVLSQFGGSGRDENFLGKAALGQIYSDAFAGQYGQERARQLNASEILPGMSLLPGQTLQNIGKQYQNLAQYQQNYPLETLYPELFAAQQGATGLVSPFTGQSMVGSVDTSGRTTGTSAGTETPSYFPANQTAGLLGGIASGAGIGGQIGGPWGAAAGAVGGGLLSFT